MDALKKLAAKFLLVGIVIFVTAIFAALITHKWLDKAYQNLPGLLQEARISLGEYWLALLLFYLVFFSGVKLLDSVISIVLKDHKS